MSALNALTATPIAGTKEKRHATHERNRRSEVHATLDTLLYRTSISTLLDELAEICAQRATESEALDTELTERWDKASGKLAVLSNTCQL